MTESIAQTPAQKQLLDEIINRKKLGDKKFHSESSLQHFGEENGVPPNTPEVAPMTEAPLTAAMSDMESEEHAARRRANSQPGPASGALVTAATARAARKRIPRAVNYAFSVDDNDSDRFQGPKLYIPKCGDDSGTATPIGDRDRNNYVYKNGDVKFLNNYRLYTPTMNGGVTPRKRSVITMDAQSIRSVETHAPPPTSPEDNKKLTTKYITVIFSAMYAVLLVTLGLMIYLSDPFTGQDISPIYSMILLIIGFIFHVYIIIDISRYKQIALKNQIIRSEFDEQVSEYLKNQEEEFNMSLSDERIPDLKPPQGIPPPVLIPLKHEYCFNQGRHSGSFYLKLGAAGFAIGHLVHSILLITVQVELLVDEKVFNDDCVNMVQLALDILNPIYCFLQLYFVFKYSNVIILKRQGLAIIVLMHIIGSCLCFWVYTIVRETTLSLIVYSYSNGKKDEENSIEQSIITDSSEGLDVVLLRTSQDSLFNVSSLYEESCMGSNAVMAIFESFSPYLYPFSVEFNILIVAVYYIIWNNIGSCSNEDSSFEEPGTSSVDNYSICKIPTASEENDYTSNMVIHADCHASNRGLFLGLIVTVIVVGMLILAFVFIRVGDEFRSIGYFLNDVTKLGLHTIMLFAAILAFTQTVKLDINEHPISLLDDILLFVCLPPFFMETVFSLVATITILNVVRSIDFSVMVVQIIVQTPLIMDGLRRCSNTRKLRRSKPGRELIMFLIITNVAMWLFYTFSYKAPDRIDERYEYYGKVLWSILGHISLPLIMFYRFHSSVCFADIWGSAYKPGSEH